MVKGLNREKGIMGECIEKLSEHNSGMVAMMTKSDYLKMPPSNEASYGFGKHLRTLVLKFNWSYFRF